MQLYHPHPPIYTNDSLSLSPPAPTLLQKRLATPPTSPDTPLPALSSSATSKRLKSSRSFPLINATNRANTPVPDVFSTTSTFTKTLRKKQSRGVLQDDTSERTLTRVASGKSERGLKSRASFQKYAPHTPHRLRRQDNSTKSLRSEYRETDPPSSTTRPSSRDLEKGSVRSGKESERRDGKGVTERKAGKRRSFEEPAQENAGSAPIPRSKSDPLSAATHASTLVTPSNSAATTSSKEDSDEETKKYDPKEVFSKERFLNRHSRDFGHLYARPATSTIPQATETTEDLNNEDAMEDLIISGPEVDIALARKEGREKRRSWALYRAGLVSPVPSAGPNGWTTPHSAPAASVSHAASVSQSQHSISGRPGHHRRVSSFLTGAHHPSVNPSPGLAASPQISSVHRQTVLSGGFKPLALVAATKGIASSPAGPERPVQRRNRWSMGSSVGPPHVEPPASAAALLHNTRDDEEEEELSVIVERESEKSRTSTSLSVSSADHSRASLSSIPAHLRNHSSSTTSSSLSSLGAVINGSSPSKSTSSCSSGGEHLGGPNVLSGESFNFRMSVVSGGGRRRSGLLSGDHYEEEMSQRSDSRMTSKTASTLGFDNIRTDSRMTLRGGRLLDGQIDPEDALAGNDKDSRAARRRARAFLVAGLKLEEGSLYQEQDEQSMSHCAKMDTTRRAGLVISQPIEWDEEAPMQENKASRKRYSVMRAEKSVPLQITTSQVQSPTTPSATLGTSLMWRQHEFQSSGASSASSYYSAVDQPLKSPAEVQFDLEEPGFMEVFDSGRPVLDDRYHGRESVSPITISSNAGTARMSPAMNATTPAPRTGLATPGITIAIYDPAGHARQASLTSVRRDSIASDRPLPVRDDSSGSSADMHLGQQGLNSLELERQLFFDHRSVRSANSDAYKSVRKVKSDIGLGANQIALPTGRSMSRPTSPVIIHEDSAGASPGRQRKTGWSKGVREWWRDDAKATAENETERGFGLGRGGDEERIPMSVVPEARHQKEENHSVVAPTPSRLLKEKKSWRPFLAALRGETWRATQQTDNQGRITGEYPLRTDTVLGMAPALMRSESPQGMTSTTTLDPPFTEQSLAACSTESTPQLSSSPASTTHFSPLPPLPTAMMGATSRFSPCSATTFSPQTPEYLTPSLGTSMRVTGIQLGQELRAQQGSHDKLLLDSQGILSPTPGISPNIPNHHNTTSVNRLLNSTQFASQPELLPKPQPVHLLAKGKSPSDPYSPTTLPPAPVFDEQGRDVRGPLHGLGLHVGWADEPIDRKGKAKAETEADEQAWEYKLTHQASQLFKLKSAQGSQPLAQPVTLTSHLGRRPAVGILTNAGLSPTAASSTWHDSPSAVTVVAPPSLHALGNQYYNTPTDHLEADDMTVATTHHSPPHGATFMKPHHRRECRTDSPSSSQEMINMHPRELQLQPAKLFFLLGFLLGPWVWLLGGWGLSPGGYFSTAGGSNGIQLGLSWQHAQGARFRRRNGLTTPSDASSSSSHAHPLLPPMSRDEPSKWVKRNRWAAVASAGVFIPAMCAGFASMGALL